MASDWHTCSMAMRLVADAALQGSESFAALALAAFLMLSVPRSWTSKPPVCLACLKGDFHVPGL
ncbi:MAG TPA: hypothetical protein VGJ72_18605 [Polaromonas sp.]